MLIESVEVQTNEIFCYVFKGSKKTQQNRYVSKANLKCNDFVTFKNASLKGNRFVTFINRLEKRNNVPGSIKLEIVFHN